MSPFDYALVPGKAQRQWLSLGAVASVVLDVLQAVRKLAKRALQHIECLLVVVAVGELGLFHNFTCQHTLNVGASGLFLEGATAMIYSWLWWHRIIYT
jgi:hypothetical protein